MNRQTKDDTEIKRPTDKIILKKYAAGKNFGYKSAPQARFYERKRAGGKIF